MRFRRIFRGSYGTDYYLSDSPPHRIGIRPHGSVRITELRDEDLSRALLAQKSVPLVQAMEAGDAETTNQG